MQRCSRLCCHLFLSRAVAVAVIDMWLWSLGSLYQDFGVLWIRQRNLFFPSGIVFVFEPLYPAGGCGLP